MQPEIKNPAQGQYQLPVFKVTTESLVPTEQEQKITFVRPEVQTVTEEQLKQAEQYKSQLKAEDRDRTEQERQALESIDALIKKGPETLPSQEGVAIVDMLQVCQLELKALKANPQAQIKLNECLFWLTQR